ncbi:MAG TPA: hypothetical protein VFV22_00035 [Candidatus Paceibacterota bacterium]|nr:hypothetical protein [Candidatus Paceibacterota bacterium]
MRTYIIIAVICVGVLVLFFAIQKQETQAPALDNTSPHPSIEEKHDSDAIEPKPEEALPVAEQPNDVGMEYPIPDDVPPSSLPTDGSDSVYCTMDAKICPDGSAVGRVGPHCEFAPCPGE